MGVEIKVENLTKRFGSQIGLLKPENGVIWINGKDITRIPEGELYEIRKLGHPRT